MSNIIEKIGFTNKQAFGLCTIILLLIGGMVLPPEAYEYFFSSTTEVSREVIREEIIRYIDQGIGGSPWQTEKDYDFLIGRVDIGATPYYYALNGTTGRLWEYSTVAADLFNWAIGNTTTAGSIGITAAAYLLGSNQITIPYGTRIRLIGLGAWTGYSSIGGSASNTGVWFSYSGPDYAINITGPPGEENTAVDIEDITIKLSGGNYKGGIHFWKPLNSLFRRIEVYADSIVAGSRGIHVHGGDGENNAIEYSLVTRMDEAYSVSAPTMTLLHCKATFSNTAVRAHLSDDSPGPIDHLYLNFLAFACVNKAFDIWMSHAEMYDAVIVDITGGAGSIGWDLAGSNASYVVRGRVGGTVPETIVDGVTPWSDIIIGGRRYGSDGWKDKTPETDHTWSGGNVIRARIGETVVTGEALWFNSSDSEWYLTDADSSATMPCEGIALSGGNDGDLENIFVGPGIYRDDTWNWGTSVNGIDNLLYVSTTPGDLTLTAPVGSGDQLQVVGYILSDDVIYFDPDWTVTAVT